MYLDKMAVDNKLEWRSCCCLVNRQFFVFVIQTIIGFCVLSFCAYQLAHEHDCNRATPYWGLVGTICGFFFRKISFTTKSSVKESVSESRP